MAQGQVMIAADGSQTALIHFDVAGHLACSPAQEELSEQFGRPWPYQRSNDPRAVTCPLCKQMEIYQQAVLGVASPDAKPPRRIVQQTCIHFLYLNESKDEWLTPCPEMEEVQRGVMYHVSDDTRAVTCERCKSSPDYQRCCDELAAGRANVVT